MTRRAVRWGVVALLGVAAAAALLLPSACSPSYARRDPTGERLPTVTGTALDGVEVTFPDDFLGAPLLLLVGYDQDAQFDLDRWLLALDQSGTKVKVFELPTIPGMVPRMFSGMIDQGMRRGIPKEDWGGVVTLYEDAAKVAEFTGNEDGLTGRVVLLDADGVVAFFHDRGFSVGSLRALEQALAALR